MGLITSNGGLTASQQERMHKLGIGQMEMLEIILREMNDRFNKSTSERPHKKVTIQSRKCYIVIGHGPDWEVQAIKAKGKGIPIIATDVCANKCFELGLIPEVIVTLEEAHKNVKENMFDWELIRKHKVKVVCSSVTREWLPEMCEKEGVKWERCLGVIVGAEVQNVGHMGVVYAYLQSCDNVIMVGMNNYGPEGYPWLDWYTQWRTWIGRICVDNYIINCTEGGILYFDKVFDIDLDDLEIV